ncbi:MAG: YbfB/YjiJ family MFS transporter [Alphaproteobacteria bacterium]|nr:YbfB/YjiJ family MFS transporter [Alphaproteobacteria bacterium]
MSPQTPTFRIVLVGLSSLAIAMGIGRFLFTPLLPLMQDDGLVSISDGGLLASIHFVGYWLGAVFAVKLPCSPKTGLRFSLIAIGLGTLGMGLTDNFIAWSILRWLCGVCSAFTLVLVSNYYIKHLANIGYAEKQGWVFSGVGAGIVVAGLGTLLIMVGRIDSAVSWQIFGVASLVAAIVICLRLGPELADSRFDAQQQKSQRSPLVWSIVIAYGAAGIGYIIPATYLPVMARDIISDPLLFGWAWPVFGAAAFLSTLFAAGIQRRHSNRQVWAASQIVMAVGLLLPVIYPHILTIIIAGICVGGTFMIITMMGMKEAHRIAPVHDVMRHISVMTAAFASGQMIGPLFASSIFDLTQSFSLALVLTSIALVITGVALLGRSASKEVLPT